MKIIPLIDGQNFKTRAVIEAVISAAGERGVTPGEMRKRMRVFSALEALTDDAVTMTLEDGDHDMLVRLIEEFRFAVCKPELVKIIDSITHAMAPPTNGAELRRMADGV